MKYPASQRATRTKIDARGGGVLLDTSQIYTTLCPIFEWSWLVSIHGTWVVIGSPMPLGSKPLGAFESLFGMGEDPGRRFGTHLKIQ